MNSQGEKSIEVNGAVCERYFACVEVCPVEIFVRESDSVRTHRHLRCIKCGHCVATCPTDAILHGSFADRKFEDLVEGPRLSLADLAHQFKSRRSCRRFSSEAVSKDEIETLIHQTRHAPTAANAQNVRYYVLTQAHTIKALRRGVEGHFTRLNKQIQNPLARFFMSLSHGKRTVEAYRYHMDSIFERFNRDDEEDRLFWGAPVVVVVAASGVSHIAAAAGNLQTMQLMLAAEAMGLGTCFNGYTLTALNRDKSLRELMEIPKETNICTVIAIGKKAGKFRKIPPRRKQRIIWVD